MKNYKAHRERVLQENGTFKSIKADLAEVERVKKIERKDFLSKEINKIMEDGSMGKLEKEGALGALKITAQELKLPECKKALNFLKKGKQEDPPSEEPKSKKKVAKKKKASKKVRGKGPEVEKKVDKNPQADILNSGEESDL